MSNYGQIAQTNWRETVVIWASFERQKLKFTFLTGPTFEVLLRESSQLRKT